MRQLAARLDTLVGEFLSLHILMLHDTSGPGTCQDALGALFSDPVLSRKEEVVGA